MIVFGSVCIQTNMKSLINNMIMLCKCSYEIIYERKIGFKIKKSQKSDITFFKIILIDFPLKTNKVPNIFTRLM